MSSSASPATRTCGSGTSPDLVGITERAAQRILHDLVQAGYVERARSGRRNSYRLALDRPMRHPVEADHPVGMLVKALVGSPG